MKIQHWIGGLLAYVIALIMLAPATWLAPLAQTYGDDRLHFSGLSGRLWNGAAEHLEIRAGDHPPLRLERFHWRLSPLRLLSGEAPIYIENGGGDLTLSGWLRPLGEGMSVRQTKLETSLATVLAWLPGLAGQGLVGTLSLSADAMTLGKTYAGEGEGVLRIDAAATLKLPAGRYRLALQGHGGRLGLRWNGPEGPRSMSGSGWWDGRLHLDGAPDTAHGGTR